MLLIMLILVALLLTTGIRIFNRFIRYRALMSEAWSVSSPTHFVSSLGSSFSSAVSSSSTAPGSSSGGGSSGGGGGGGGW